MDERDLNKLLKNQFGSLKNLEPPAKYAATIQTLRMGLQMVRLHMKEKVTPYEFGSWEEIFGTLDTNLNFVLDPNYDDDSEEEFEESCGEDCIHKIKIDPENFSERNKEESDWASSFTSDSDEEKVVKEEAEEEVAKWDAKENDIPVEKMFYYNPHFATDFDTIYSKTLSIVDSAYTDFLTGLASKNVYTDSPNKLYCMMDMYRESHNSINELKLNNIFKLLFEYDCEQFLDAYYH